MQEQTVNLIEIEKLLKENPNLEIETPDGWVRVNKFFNQGVKQTYKVVFNNGLETISTLDHKYQTNLGMIPLEDIKEQHNVLTKLGYTQIKHIVKDKLQNTYDIEVNHNNHRFYSDEVCVSNCADAVNTFGLFETIVLDEESEEFNPYLYNGHILTLDHRALWHSISMFKHNLPLNDLEGLRENTMTIANRLIVLEEKYKRIKGAEKYSIGSPDDINYLIGSKILNELLKDSIKETLHIDLLRPEYLKKNPKIQTFLDYISADYGLIGKIENNKSRGEFIKFETRKVGWGSSAKGVPVLEYTKKSIKGEYWVKMLDEDFREDIYTLVSTIDDYRGLVLELQRLGKMYRYAVADDRGYATANISLQFNGTDCVIKGTKVKIRYRGITGNITKKICITEIKNFLDNNTYIEVKTPDGWVRVIDYIVKKNKSCYMITLENGLYCGSAEKHLFQLANNDWKLTKDLEIGDELITVKGYSKILTIEPLGVQDVYDITVDHENHRYYSNGICSHNTRRYKNSSGNGSDRLILSGAKLNLLSYFGGNALSGINAQGLPSTAYSFIKKSENDIGEVKKIISIKDKEFSNWFKRKKQMLYDVLLHNLKTKFSQKK